MNHYMDFGSNLVHNVNHAKHSVQHAVTNQVNLQTAKRVGNSLVGMGSVAMKGGQHTSSDFKSFVPRVHLESGFVPPAELARRKQERAKLRAPEKHGKGSHKGNNHNSRRSRRTMDASDPSIRQRTSGMSGSGRIHRDTKSGRSQKTAGSTLDVSDPSIRQRTSGMNGSGLINEDNNKSRRTRRNVNTTSSRRQRTVPLEHHEASNGSDGTGKSSCSVPEKYYRQGKPARRRVIGLPPPKDDGSEGDGIFLQSYKGTTAPTKKKGEVSSSVDVHAPPARTSFVRRDSLVIRK